MLRIKQCGDWNTMRQMPGVQAYHENGVWYFAIDEKVVDFLAIKPLLPSEEYEKLCQLHAKEITFSGLFQDIPNVIKLSKVKYAVIGDIHEVYQTELYSIYTMIDNQNLRQSIRIIAKKESELALELLDKRVKATGILDFYRPYAIFQLQAEKIEVLGDCSRLEKIREWSDDLKPLFEKEKVPLNIEFTHIGLIANKSSRAYIDFLNHLKPLVKSNVTVIEKETSMIPDNIIDKINELNVENQCQYICIVRGGGDPEELLPYSHPDFVRAIAKSCIPVITGIAHDKDKLLCDLVAACNAGTPTGAAEKFNELAGIKRARERKEEYKEKLIQLRNERIDVNMQKEFFSKNYNELLDDYIKLQAENEDLKQQIDQYNHSGFLSKLLNWIKRDGGGRDVRKEGII